MNKVNLRKYINKTNTITVVGSILFTIFCFSIIIFRIGFPHHKNIAVFLYIISWLFYTLPLIRKVDKKRLEHFKSKKELKWFLRNKTLVIISLLLSLFAYLLIILFPGIRVDYLNLDKQALSTKISTDEIYLNQVIKSLEKVNQRYSYLDFENIGIQNHQDIIDSRQYWSELLDHMLVLNKLTQEYRYFYQIDPARYGDLHSRAFMIAYTSYMLEYKSIHDLAFQVNENTILKTSFNEFIPGMGDNLFKKATSSILSPNNLLRVNAGFAYLKTIKSNPDLRKVSQDIYKSISSDLKKSVRVTSSIAMDLLEDKTMQSWLPIQKGISMTLSETRFKNRERNLISIAQLEEVDKQMEPGDLLLERKNWYATNASMPGFWTHAAMYMGDMQKLDSFFAKESKEEFSKSFSDHIQENFPKFFNDNKLSYNDSAFVNTYRTIEAKGPGVIQMSLEDSANADYLAVLRPQFSKKTKMYALINAIKNYGKPYDFNFDFSTNDELVCSEMYYKAYTTQDDEKLKYDMRMVAGRNLVAPNHMAEDFDKHYGTDRQQYDFVLFLDGSEKRQSAELMGINEFRRSWQRPKHDFILHY